MRSRALPWLVLVACCSCGNDGTRESVAVDFATMSDSAKVLLIDEIPIGLTAAQVRERIPTLPPLKRYVADHLQQVSMPVTLFDRSAELTFNFEDSVLYGYYYDGDLCWPVSEADSILERVSDRLSSRFGRFIYEQEANHPYDLVYHKWQAEGFDALTTMSLRGERNCIALSYQVPLSTALTQ